MKRKLECYMSIRGVRKMTKKITTAFGINHYKKCVGCNELFYAKHLNTKYCNNCDRRTYWSRKTRARLKESANNEAK